MAGTVTLVLPIGADTGPISYDTGQFIPYREDHTNPSSRLLVDVPRDVAERLIGVGGFILAQTKAMSAAEIRSQTDVVRMFHPDSGSTDVYAAEDGFYLVPNGPEVDVMRSHGFRIEGEEVGAKPASSVSDDEHLEALAQIDAKQAQINAIEARVTDLGRDLQIARGMIEAKDSEIAKLNDDLKAAAKPAA